MQTTKTDTTISSTELLLLRIMEIVNTENIDETPEEEADEIEEVEFDEILEEELDDTKEEDSSEETIKDFGKTISFIF